MSYQKLNNDQMKNTLGVLPKFLFLILVFSLQGCAEGITERTNQEEVMNEDSIISKIDSIQIFQTIGRSEYEAFLNKYESYWKSKGLVEFPNTEPSLIKVFSLHSDGEYRHSEFTKRTSSGSQINQIELDRLLKILMNPDSYGNSQAACYDPGFGLVIYDEDGIPAEWLSICLDCNRFLTNPGKLTVNYKSQLLEGFNQKARDEIRELIMTWGIDYYGYSSLHDDKTNYQDYLNRKQGKTNLTRDSKTTETDL